jgi:hypothetical protein
MPESATSEETMPDEDAYDGVLGAFPYALRTSDSRLFKSYAVLGSLLAALIALVFTFALVQLIAVTTGTAGGVFTFSRAFFVFVGMLIVFPLIAPVLSVARRHRRTGSSTHYDFTIAVTGYLFLFAIYLALVISTPAEQQETPPAVVAPVVEILYGLPALYGLVPPTIVAVAMYLVHRNVR